MTDTITSGTDPAAAHHEVLETPGHPGGDGLVKPEYDDRLANTDLAPLKKQTWSSYNIFAFWMSDVHSVGGYVTAGSLFALGIASWQVLLSLLIGIVHRQRLLQPGGQAESGHRRALPGDQSGDLRGPRVRTSPPSSEA